LTRITDPDDSAKHICPDDQIILGQRECRSRLLLAVIGQGEKPKRDLTVAAETTEVKRKITAKKEGAPHR
jgi:hypothetical protein